MGWRGRKREKEVEIEKVVRTERGKKDGGLVKQGRGEEWGCMVWVWGVFYFCRGSKWVGATAVNPSVTFTAYSKQ